MLTHIKKYGAICLLGIQGFALMLTLLYLGFSSDHVRGGTVFGGERISYVLVNEDLGATE